MRERQRGHRKPGRGRRPGSTGSTGRSTESITCVLLCLCRDVQQAGHRQQMVCPPIASNVPTTQPPCADCIHSACAGAAAGRSPRCGRLMSCGGASPPRWTVSALCQGGGAQLLVPPAACLLQQFGAPSGAQDVSQRSKSCVRGLPPRQPRHITPHRPRAEAEPGFS